MKIFNTLYVIYSVGCFLYCLVLWHN